jgi:predicted transcriptional regulator
MSISDSQSSDYVALAAEVVSAFVGHNSLPVSELPSLITSVHAALVKISGGSASPAPAEPEVLTPAVPVRKSITPDYLVCLDDGRKFKSLKRHLASLGMTPDQYRAKWSLPADYPMVASNYAATRSALAKKIGLGQNRKRG